MGVILWGLLLFTRPAIALILLGLGCFTLLYFINRKKLPPK